MHFKGAHKEKDMNKKLNEIIVLEKIYLLREAKKKHKIFKKIKIANTEFLISKN